MKNFCVELIGTFACVFIGCGAIVFALPFIGYLGAALAFGLGYAAVVSTFEQGQFNPAATIALALTGKNNGKKVKLILKTAGTVVVQLAGACAAVSVIALIYSGKTGFVHQTDLAANIIDRYSLFSAYLCETVLTVLFLCAYLTTSGKGCQRALATGAVITGGLLLSYPITKGSLNAARTTASALIGRDPAAIDQLAVFWQAALTAAIITGLAFNPKINPFLKKENQ